MTLHVTLFNLTQLTELSQLHISSGFFKSTTFWSIEKPMCYYVTYTWLFLFTLSISLNQPSLLVGWPFYNFKSFKPNKLANPFWKRTKKTFRYLWALVKALYSAIAMVRSCVCQSPCQNSLPAGKDELTGAAPRAPTNDNGTPSHITIVSCVTTPASASTLAPLKLMAKYAAADLQKATKLALKLFV